MLLQRGDTFKEIQTPRKYGVVNDRLLRSGILRTARFIQAHACPMAADQLRFIEAARAIGARGGNFVRRSGGSRLRGHRRNGAERVPVKDFFSRGIDRHSDIRRKPFGRKLFARADLNRHSANL